MAADPSEIEGADDALAAESRLHYPWLMAGLPVSTLARLFRIERDTVRRKIAGLKPIGERKGVPLYNVGEAAEYLVTPKVDLEAYLKKLRPQDMPQAIQKSFWDAQNGRLKFMTDAGHLWHTVKVQQTVAEIFKIVRQRVLLFSDTVERQTSLTDEQRRIVTAMGDGLLDDMHAAIVEHFKNAPPSGERDDIFENGPPSANLGQGEDEEDEWGGL